MSVDNTHQDWLARAYAALRERFLPAAPGRDQVIVSYGFPKGRSGRGKRIGECWHNAVPEGTKAVIFIHPCQWTSPEDVLHVLLHEQIHALHPEAGHKGEGANAAAVREAVEEVVNIAAGLLGPELKDILEVAQGRAGRTLGPRLCERDWRLIRFGLLRALESL